MNRNTIFTISSLILVIMISFNLGRLKASRDLKENISIYENKEELTQTDFKVYGSIKGSKYHYPWCSGAKTISEKNKIEFENEQAAILAGYTLAGNCSK